LVESDDTTHFTYDSVISTQPTNCNDSIRPHDNYKFTRQSSVQRLLEDLEFISDGNYEEMLEANAKGSNNDLVESLINCASPSSLSSGCESDFTSSCDEEQFIFPAEVGFLSFREEPFSELFPALY